VTSGIGKVEYAVTEKNFSPVLTGIFVRTKEYNAQQYLVFVGTDSFRLAEYKIPVA
jgi:DNA polymerase III sliding clamp (beta) subunit (PCNA family)